MRVIPIANQAGSAGKTSTAVTIAALLSEAGHRVLLIDADPQANASAWLGHPTETVTIGDVLLRQADMADAVIETEWDRLRLLPASPALDGSAVTLARTTGGEQRLRQALDTWADSDSDGIDVVLIDCPGAMSVLTIAALVAATSVITVTQPTIKELEGLPKLEETITEVADAYRPGLTLAAVVPCIVPSATAGAVYSESMTLLREAYPELITPAVRRSARVPEAYAQRRPLPMHAPQEAVTSDYREVVDQLVTMGVLPAAVTVSP
jgi:chromosome partitioning protein